MAIFRTSSRLRQKTYTSNQEWSSFIEDVFFPDVQYLNPDKVFSGDRGDEMDSETFYATSHNGYIYVWMATGWQSASRMYLTIFKFPEDGSGEVETFTYNPFISEWFINFDANDNYLNWDDITINVNVSWTGNYVRVDFDTTTDLFSETGSEDRSGTQLDEDIDYLWYNYEVTYTSYRAGSDEEPLVPLLKVTKL